MNREIDILTFDMWLGLRVGGVKWSIHVDNPS